MSSKTGHKASQTAALLQQYGITQSSVVKGTGISRSAISRLCAHAEWPLLDVDLVKTKIDAYLRSRGLVDAQMTALCLSLQVRALKQRPHLPTAQLPTNPEPIPLIDPTTEKEESMLLQHQALTEHAKKYFKLFRSPFANDINTQADVFTSGPMHYVRNALWDCAQNHGFMAVVGESGSGKTTLREEFEERIREFGKGIIVIKPFVVGMEVNDTKGKTMKCGQIADAIARTLSPGLTLKSNPDARFEQVTKLLSSSVASGYSHLILIEEAHRLPQATLRHLKGFMELKEGMRRLLGVCLVGQPELDHLLGANQREIREIVQRCERVTLAPLGDELHAYLAHKFDRVGTDIKTVLAPDAFDAIARRLSYVPRGGKPTEQVSICYPLVVNNLVARAMNAAALAAWPNVDAQVIAGC